MRVTSHRAGLASLAVSARRAPRGPPRQSAALTPGQRRRLRRRLDLAAGTLTIEVTRVVIDGKVIESDGKRIGHAYVAFTMKQYVQTDLEADRQVATTLAALIVGGSLASTEITRKSREDQAAAVGGDSGEAA